VTHSPRVTHAELEAELAAQKKKGKPFARPWLDVAALGPLRAVDGQPLSPAALAFVFDAQSRCKANHPAPAIVDWQQAVDRTQSGAFAHALVRQWLGGEQDSKDRWALVLAGTFGDDRVTTELLPWIPKWCEAARHKLAEYAAQAIALLGTDHALMVLDALRTRYRSKFRNVGAACAAAFEQAATSMGITPDELGDRVMPKLDFDADGQRRLEWPGGASIVEIGPLGKLAWVDPETDKRAKSPPKGLPPAIAAEVKELTKQIREARKAQAMRLELAMVRQRRWTAARFVQLFVDHPLARSFAGQLVFGVFDANGKLLRCCRRYDNGVLANERGAMEELGEPGLQVGIVHPLELDPASIAAWREHFARNRVEPFFEQLDRPVHTKDPAHGNRRELITVNGRSLASGTFRGRAERRGFHRGSVVDAGGVTNYWKDFPGCGLEVVLELDGMYVGIDPMESITLGIARFVRSGSVQRGSYVYDDAQGDDPRVVAFGEVPPVVWSETIADLEAIAPSEGPAR